MNTTGNVKLEDYAPHQNNDPSGKTIRVRVTDDDSPSFFDDALALWLERFAALLEEPWVERIESLSIGFWGFESSQPIIEALVAARTRLPALRHLTLGDATEEEISLDWLWHDDLSPMIGAYPHLETLLVVGQRDLRFGVFQHAALRSLSVYSLDTNPELIFDIVHAELPALQNLSLCIGEYEWEPEEFAALNTGVGFPALQRLALLNDARAEEWIGLLSSSGLLKHLETLDLSYGSLRDEQAEVIGACSDFGGLKELCIDHHQLSQGAYRRLQARLEAQGVRISGSRDDYDNVRLNSARE